jgi:alpha-N-acetylglucosaminidase
MTQQWQLQRQILERMRALGIVPVLPAFQGNVPPLMAELYPEANITVQDAHWGGGIAAWLDALDPLFQEIGDAVMRTVIQDFGIDTDGDGAGDETEH